jgi:hypothetical protein
MLTTDKDQDGLNSLLEDIYGLSDSKSDTDSDGVTDLQEAGNEICAWAMGIKGIIWIV